MNYNKNIQLLFFLILTLSIIFNMFMIKKKLFLILEKKFNTYDVIYSETLEGKN